MERTLMISSLIANLQDAYKIDKERLQAVIETLFAYI